jgi:hypothetical protein
VPKDQNIQFRLVVSEQHSGPQVLPLVAFQQALWVLDLEPHAGGNPHSPFERARSRPLSQSAIANNVQNQRCDCAVGCADDKSGEGSGAAGIEVDVLVLGETCDDVEDLGD